MEFDPESEADPKDKISIGDIGTPSYTTIESAAAQIVAGLTTAHAIEFATKLEELGEQPELAKHVERNWIKNPPLQTQVLTTPTPEPYLESPASSAVLNIT